jgi:hypothetical protein
MARCGRRGRDQGGYRAHPDPNARGLYDNPLEQGPPRWPETPAEYRPFDFSPTSLVTTPVSSCSSANSQVKLFLYQTPTNLGSPSDGESESICPGLGKLNGGRVRSTCRNWPVLMSIFSDTPEWLEINAILIRDRRKLLSD